MDTGIQDRFFPAGKKEDNSKIRILIGFLILALLGVTIGLIIVATKSHKCSSSQTTTTSLDISQLSAQEVTSMFSSKTFVWHHRYNESVPSVMTSRIYFDGVSTLSRRVYGQDGSLTSTNQGTWAALKDNTAVNITWDSGESYLAYFYGFGSEKTRMAIAVNKALFASIYQEDISDGNSVATFNTYTSPPSYVLRQLTVDEALAFLSDRTVSTRITISPIITTPIIKSFYASNGTIIRLSINRDGQVVSRDNGLWGVFKNEQGVTIQWQQFPTIYAGTNRTGIWINGNGGHFPTGGIPLNGSAVGFVEFLYEGFTYASELRSGYHL